MKILTHSQKLNAFQLNPESPSYFSLDQNGNSNLSAEATQIKNQILRIHPTAQIKFLPIDNGGSILIDSQKLNPTDWLVKTSENNCSIFSNSEVNALFTIEDAPEEDQQQPTPQIPQPSQSSESENTSQPEPDPIN